MKRPTLKLQLTVVETDYYDVSEMLKQKYEIPTELLFLKLFYINGN